MKNKPAAAISAVLAFFLIISGSVQLFSITTDQYPPDTEWRKIETEHFILIYPAEIEDKAPETAAMLEAFHPADTFSLETETMKWPVIINNTSMYINAYVTGAPRHSQLYTVPSQEGFNGNLDWLPYLWSHELRHIVQNDKMLSGFTAFAHFLFGEYGSAAMVHFALPRWLMEGDAVLTETLLSTGGRGRYAEFDRQMRTDLLNGTSYNYYKASLGYYGSYRDSVPSWYIMGYHLTTHIRREYGVEAFNRIFDIAADFSFTPLILNIAVKQVTGKSITDIYEDCLDELSELWSKQLDGRYITDIEIIKAAEDSKRSSFYPLGVFSDGNIAALRTSNTSIYSLVKIFTDGQVQLLRKISPLEKNISFNGTEFCWTESKSDVRWGNLSWGVIRKYNPDTGEYRLVTKKSRYLSPSPSPDGSMIAAVEVSPQLDNYIVVLDADTGEVLQKFAEPAGAAALQPCWSEDGSSIVYLRQYNCLKSLRLIEAAAGTAACGGDGSEGGSLELTVPAVHNISDPEVAGGRVYFVSDESGIEGIYSVGMDGGVAAPAVLRPYGALSPAAGRGELLFADYSADGFSAAAASVGAMEATVEAAGLSAAATAAAAAEAVPHVDYFDGLQEQEARAGMLGAADVYAESEDYSDGASGVSKAAGIINFHSRSIASTASGTGIALSLQADDILNYSSGNLYIGYDPTAEEFAAGFGQAWAGLYPILLYGAELQTPVSGFGTEFQSSAYAGAAVPFDFSSGIYSHSLILQEVLSIESYLYPEQQHAAASTATVSWSLTQKTAKRDIIPPLGIYAAGSWYYYLTQDWYNFISAETEMYMPGLLENHGLTIGLSADWNMASAQADIQPSHYPRGCSADEIADPAVVGGSIDYTFPIAYPDWAIGGIMYVSRIFGNGFIDAAWGWESSDAVFGTPAAEMLSTAGFELYADFHLFNNIVPLRSGLRFIYDLNDGGMRIEDTVLLLGFDLP